MHSTHTSTTHFATSYPLISCISDVVAPSNVFPIPAPAGIISAPNALCLVRHVGRPLPQFSQHPARFTIPGTQLSDAQEFVRAMSTNIHWNIHRTTHNDTPEINNPSLKHRQPANGFKLEYTCPSRGLPNPTPGSRKRHHISACCDCKARFSIFFHIRTSSIRVDWHWQHNHNPNSHLEMVIARAPTEVDNWLKAQVDLGLEWRKLRRLIQPADICDLTSDTIKPEGLRVMYDRARYLKRTRVTHPAKRDVDVFKSLRIWNQELLDQNWNTYVRLEDSEDFIFAFQSPWQKEKGGNFGQPLIMVDATHNSVSHSFLSDGKKVSLYTIMVRDAVVGKGLPIAWAFTASAAEEPLACVLGWLQTSSRLVPQAIMSDCAMAIANAVQSSYSNSVGPRPKHYWCLFHVLKAFQAQAKTYLQHRADEAIWEFRQLIYCTTNPISLLDAFLVRWSSVSQGFGKYFQKQWTPRLANWAIYYRTTAHQGVHTNNYTEAWHRVLKSRYIPPPERKRIDELIDILTGIAEPDFRWEHLRVSQSFLGQTTNRFQQRAKAVGKSYCATSLWVLGIIIFQSTNHFLISSFTNPITTTYRVTIERLGPSAMSQLTSCTCGHFMQCGSACKHMYYLAHEHRFLVVESIETIADTTNQPIILDNVDSDIEVVPTNHHKVFPTANLLVTNSTTQLGVTQPRGPQPLVTNITTGLAAAQRKRPRDVFTAWDTTVSPVTSGAGTTRFIQDGQGEADEQSVDDINLNRRAEASSHAALKQMVDLMKAKANRLEFAASASPIQMQQFTQAMHFILRKVENVCPGVPLTPTTNVDRVANAGMMNRKEVEGLIEELQALGLDFLKKIVKLLGEPRNRAQLISASTCTQMDEYRERCFDLLGMLEDNVIGARRKKQQR